MKLIVYTGEATLSVQPCGVMLYRDKLRILLSLHQLQFLPVQLLAVKEHKGTQRKNKHQQTYWPLPGYLLCTIHYPIYGKRNRASVNSRGDTYSIARLLRPWNSPATDVTRFPDIKL